MAQASITHPNPEIHLKRAFAFIQEVEKATEEFRDQAVAHDAQTNSNEPFLQGVISTVRGSRQLAQQKAALSGDLQLAEQEVNRAAEIDSSTEIDTRLGSLGTLQLRAWIMYARGQIEMIWGSGEAAIRLFNDCIQMMEFAEPHYMLGIVYEGQYRPVEALIHFERCLELDPVGELSVPALREANAMRNYKKRFRGSWGTFFLLLCIWPAAIIYFFVKRR
jgi:tetratricopeptide (TPR) repeat protein